MYGVRFKLIDVRVFDCGSPLLGKLLLRSTGKGKAVTRAMVTAARMESLTWTMFRLNLNGTM